MPNYTIKRTIIGQLERGTDLYNGIARVAQENNITVGRVTGMGAVQRAKLAYYDQKVMKYEDIVFNEPMEIVSLYGNISIRDGKPFAHIHVVLSDEKGNGKGGHLLPGDTPVFACEVTIEEFDGPELVRNADEKTGLALWGKDKTL
ncbi:MAG: PPC domain-containing DNA-binding protein [Bacteroidota bacterium]